MSMPTQTSRQGFLPLSNQSSYNNINNMETDIPLTTVGSNGSSTGVRRAVDDGESPIDFAPQKSFPQDREKVGFFNRVAGRRKIVKDQIHRVNSDDETSLTAMGKIYDKIVNFSNITRYMVYVIPIGLVLAVPVVVTATIAPDARIGGVRMVWFWSWIEIVWFSVWISKVVAKAIPGIFMFLCGVVSSGTRKYALAIKNLEVPITLLGWAATSFVTFQALTGLPDNESNGWTTVMDKILGATLIASAIYLVEKLLIQLLSISYHRRSFDTRIKESKRSVHLLGLLYDASRSLFPMYCQEFEEEDLLISDSIEAMLAKGKKGHMGHSRSGSVTPMRIIGDVGRFGDKVTSVFGNMASEISGKQVFNPTSAHSIVVEALEKKRSSEALARRLWMSFVVEGKDALYPDDVREVLGPARQEDADEAFAAIDQDGNGDISLDEMIMKVVEIGTDRKAIASSMNDIGQAIGNFDQILALIAFLIMIFVFVAFLSPNFVTTLTTTGTTLLSLSFVFSVTAQEFLGSCIFLFVKHPFDVGDRVDITGPEKEFLVVEQISLLYTVFKRIDCMKMVQVPNIVLNSMWIENVSRSKAMKEQLDMFISFDTSLEDIETLRKEMEAFVRGPENSRDFQPDIVLECTGIGNMDKLQLRVEIKHKSNWSNETVRAARRSKFMCALVLALRKVPIYCPGGGGLPLGDPGNPSYSVAVSDEIAAAARDKAAKNKEGKRLIPNKPAVSPSGGGSTRAKGNLRSLTSPDAEIRAADSLNARRPTDDETNNDWFNVKDGGTMPGSRDESLDRGRSNDIEDLRESLLKRESTRGRRRRGERAPPLPTGSGGPGMILTQPSPNKDGFDEEANVGINMDSRLEVGRGASSSGSGGAPSYSMFPQSRLQPLQSAAANVQPSRTRGLSIDQRKS